MTSLYRWHSPRGKMGRSAVASTVVLRTSGDCHHPSSIHAQSGHFCPAQRLLEPISGVHLRSPLLPFFSPKKLCWFIPLQRNLHSFETFQVNAVVWAGQCHKTDPRWTEAAGPRSMWKMKKHIEAAIFTTISSATIRQIIKWQNWKESCKTIGTGHMLWKPMIVKMPKWMGCQLKRCTTTHQQ